MSQVWTNARWTPLVIVSHPHPEAFTGYLEGLGVPAKRVEGCYQGKAEASFVMPACSLTEPLVAHLRREGEREALWLSPTEAWSAGRRHAWIVPLDGSAPSHIGLLAAAGTTRPADCSQDGTWDDATGVFWTVEPTCGRVVGLDSTKDIAAELRRWAGEPPPPLCGNMAGFECGWHC